MLFALLTLLVAVQTQPAKLEPVQTVAAPIAAPAAPAAPTPPVAPASASVATVDTAEAAAPQPEAEPEAEVEAPLPTRQVCRYVQVTGQRFPVRSCRTVTIYPDEGQ